MTQQSVYILSADGKDLFLAGGTAQEGQLPGYEIRQKNGAINTRRFTSVLDHSLDLIKLREVYQKVYRNRYFSFVQDGKEYCRSVISVSFQYSVKEYNRLFGGLYVRFGYQPQAIDVKDCSCVEEGVLVAIQTGLLVEAPLPQSVLGSWFYFEDGVYKARSGIKTVLSVAEIREALYRDGFCCDGIHYVRYKRSSGSSRVGRCLFIDEKLYSRMHRWEMAGISHKIDQQTDLAALESYIALTLSSIIGTLTIQPENFLVLDDHESAFQSKAAAVTSDREDRLKAQIKEVKIRNNIWDGQSLMDSSLFPPQYRQYSMILLRNRLFKSACFQCSLQQYFQDQGITDISQLQGRTSAKTLSQIKIITTRSSIKYLKFSALEDWFKAVSQAPDFGIVKHEKPTPFFQGSMVQTHYQLLNTLQLSEEEVELLLKPSLDYIDAVRDHPAVLRHHIRHQIQEEPEAAASTAAIVYQMLGITDRFSETKLYHEFQKDLIKSMRNKLRCGHILVNGNYSTLLGNPLEMLAASIGAFDGSTSLPAGTVHSTAFPDGVTLLGARSPHVTMGNLWLAQNRRVSEITRYFHLTKEIICVNSIGENLLMRLSGADFDSDTVLLTDDPLLVNAARRNYGFFPVPTNMVKAKKKLRAPISREQSDLDTCSSVNKIGEIVNLSQELNSLLWHKLNCGESLKGLEDLYLDAAILDVLSGIEIDKAKREYAIDTGRELTAIKERYTRRDEKGRVIKPYFFGMLARIKDYYDPDKKAYQLHFTSMDHLQRVINKRRRKGLTKEFTPFSQLLKPDGYSSSNVSYRQIHTIVNQVRATNSKVKEIWNSSGLATGEEKYLEACRVRQDISDFIGGIRLNSSTMYRLLAMIEEPQCQDIRRTLFTTLFSTGNKSFFQLIQAGRTPLGSLTLDDEGDLVLHGRRYRLLN